MHSFVYMFIIIIILDHLKPYACSLAILKPLEECARAQSISQHADAGQLNVPHQQ